MYPFLPGVIHQAHILCNLFTAGVMPPNPPFPRGTSPPAGTDSRRTGAAWAGLCGVGLTADFGVGALIRMVVIMIGPPKSEKWPRHPTAVTPPQRGRAGRRSRR